MLSDLYAHQNFKISVSAMGYYWHFEKVPFIAHIVSTTVMVLTKEDLQRISAPAGYINAHRSEGQVKEEYKILFLFPQKKFIYCFQAS